MNMIEAHAFEIIGSIITVLLVVNGFFIARLVKRIDTSNAVATESANKVERLESELKHVNEKVSELADLYTRIVTLEKQVAVFEYVLKTKKSKPTI